MRRLSFVLIALVAFAAGSAFARPMSTEEKITDFRGLVAQIKSGYGPIRYKKEVMGIDIDVLAPKYEARIAASTTNRDFYYAMAQFITEFRDGHFNAMIPTTHQKTLPFMNDLVEGKVLIDSIDRSQLSEAAFPFERGDEVVMFDGRPVGDVVSEIMTYVQSGTELSVRRKSVWTLTLRRGSRLPVPVGTEIGETRIKHARAGRVETVAAGVLKWIEAGEALDEFDPAKERPLSVVKSLNTNYGVLSVREEYESLLGKNIERSYACNPGTRIAIPEGATVLMNPPNGPFTAYYHYDARFGGNVGYLRIPDYSPQDELGNFAYEERFAQYQYAVDMLERNTVGLVIDQDHNCGGSVEYLEQMLGLFFTQQYKPTMFQLLATKESYFDLKTWVDALPPFTIGRDRVQAVLNLVRTTAETRQSWLTTQTGITGRDFYQPNEVHYTKPIVVLADEMAGSGGDAFPSMLGFAMGGAVPRATLIGTQTSGLDGHVQEMSPLYYSRFSGRLTKSLFYRADGVPVENNGAVPSAENRYTPTYNDFVDGYREYQAFYLNKLLGLVKARR